MKLIQVTQEMKRKSPQDFSFQSPTYFNEFIHFLTPKYTLKLMLQSHNKMKSRNGNHKIQGMINDSQLRPLLSSPCDRKKKTEKSKYDKVLADMFMQGVPYKLTH